MTNEGSSFKVGGAYPIDRRYLRSIYRDGTQLANAKIASGFEFITSSGAFGPYSITFAPVVFSDSPRIVTTLGLAGGANFSILAITAVTALGFTFSLAEFSPGLAVIPAASTILVEWLAVGT